MYLYTTMTNFDLESIYFNETLGEWVVLLHQALVKKFDLKTFKIEPNDYGYDSYAAILVTILSHTSLTEILSSIKNDLDLTKYIQMVHEAWSENYIRWKQTQKEIATKNPKKGINTFDRNDRATTSVDNLAQDDLESYRDIIVVVFELLTKKLLEAGMQQLTI